MTHLVAHSVHPWRLPLSAPIGGLTERQGWHTRLVDASGAFGLGEHAPWLPAAPPACPFEIGAPVELRVGLPAGWSTASLALIARRRALPAAAVLCRKPAARVPAHALVHDPQSAQRAVEAGYRTLKVKIGRLDTERLDQLVALCAAAPSARLRVDVNGGWTPAEARKSIPRLVEACPLDWVEQPTPRVADLRGLGARIAWDESLRSGDWAAALALGDAAVIKPTWQGGPHAARLVGQAALDAGLAVCVTSVLGSAIDRWAALHTALSLCGEVSVGLGGPECPGAPPIVDGFAHLPAAPGLCP